MNAPGLEGVNLYSYQYLYRPICPRIRVWSLHDSKFQCVCIWTNPCITTSRFLAYRTHLYDNASKYHWTAASSHPRFRSCLPRATKTPMPRRYRGRHASTYSASRCESVNESKYRAINGYLNEGIEVSRHPGLTVSRHEGAQACRTRVRPDTRDGQ